MLSLPGFLNHSCLNMCQQEDKNSTDAASTQQELAKPSLRDKQPAFDRPRELFGNFAVTTNDVRNATLGSRVVPLQRDFMNVTWLTWPNIQFIPVATSETKEASHLLAFPQCQPQTSKKCCWWIHLPSYSSIANWMKRQFQEAKCPWQWLTASFLRQRIQSHWMPNRRSRRRHPTTPVSSGFAIIRCRFYGRIIMLWHLWVCITFTFVSCNFSCVLMVSLLLLSQL